MALACILALSLAACSSTSRDNSRSANKYRLRFASIPQLSQGSVVILSGGPPEFWKAVRKADSLPAPVASIRVRIIDEQTGKPSPNAILGKHRLERGRLLFVPAFPLTEGANYEIEFTSQLALQHGTSSTRMTVGTRTPRTAKPTPARLTNIHPSADSLPENQLKLYLLFSQPMEQGDAFRHLKLIDETTGSEVPEPFRKVELWSEDGKRFTLWIHPGRQKTGVNLNEDIGPVLQAGHRYTLIVSQDWRSVGGSALGRDVRKAFIAGPAIRRRVTTDDWKITVPKSGSRTPLRVRFPAPLDWALLHSRVRVESGGRGIPGTIRAHDQETEWRFTPDSPWTEEKHELVIDALLEDLAGNNLKQPFEVDIRKPREKRPDVIRIPFETRR